MPTLEEISASLREQHAILSDVAKIIEEISRKI